VKSLYTACEALDRLGCCRIAPFHEPRLATWFEHSCRLYDESYAPDLIVHPEVYQPDRKAAFQICFVLGKWGEVCPHANLAVCRSDALTSWVEAHHPDMPTSVIRPAINRSVFEYDGRPKRDSICYMTRPHKHPETAKLLRERYGDKVVEIVSRSEAEVAEMLKSAKVFVCRGNDKEGSPRPPKEALVAGCVVVGLTSDLNAGFHTDFGLRCGSVEEMIDRCEEALGTSVPTLGERAVVRDSEDEKQDWAKLVASLGLIPASRDLPGA
jgi:hypothetical protein